MGYRVGKKGLVVRLGSEKDASDDIKNRLLRDTKC